jgi:hypothetical protein
LLYAVAHVMATVPPTLCTTEPSIRDQYKLMSQAIKDSRPPSSEGITGGTEYGRTEQEVIDEDLHVTIYKSDASSNWYVQYNHPSEGQRKQSLRTKNKKSARRKAWEILLKLGDGDLVPRRVEVRGGKKPSQAFLPTSVASAAGKRRSPNIVGLWSSSASSSPKTASRGWIN